MKLKDITASLEISKRLKEKGVKQDSIFYWGTEVGIHDNYSAFTATELLALLPKYLGHYEFGLTLSVNNQNEFVVYYDKIDDNGQEQYFYCSGYAIRYTTKPEDALAEMLEYLIDNKSLKRSK